MWEKYLNAASIDEVLQALARHREKARIVAGGTDLILEIERGSRQGIELLVDVTRIPGLDEIHLDEDGWIHLGPLVTHNHCASSRLIREFGLPLALATWSVGSPQIRNRGTIAGNLVTASPANDSITPLLAMKAAVVLKSTRGERQVRLEDFYLGVRKVDMAQDEMIVDIKFPAMKKNQRGTFTKFALRRAQAISVINVALVLTFEGERITDAAVTLGAVAPTIIHAKEAEEYLREKALDEETINQAAELAAQAAAPIDDVRSSANYRRRMVRVVTRRALEHIRDGIEAAELPENPVLLRGTDPDEQPVLLKSSYLEGGAVIETRINGVPYRLKAGQGKTLLRLLREDALLTGTKEGCAEGECGACTVFLDGVAVMSCLVPGERAHGADITTIEGVGSEEALHPVQTAFIEEGAVQCGYCTPGFIMSAVKLLEERPSPTQEEIRQAITGNLCRCTGYYKIVQAIDHAAQSINGR